ncbi:Rieske 2Fe-2S domain-containing protein [Mycolicibacterium phlei]|uniref:Rieske 2Fe-2S domain-containing protein n=1 Tax=Mycolicibacterium phlei TaxID=1771 RepID=UPI00025AD4B1|nr:Rieske 2Fe-2S domain-containing protein [Mycolicibacterium phlei]EID11735.1 Rieske (2Fe-2S) domain-containing protein [Mycolicibacterium phlei RIVM601174]MBF4193914.1 Rieske (2Fe-2S) domain-containing protein [Mycolicibacterium phlei]
MTSVPSRERLRPHWLPTGWFQVGWSSDFPAQGVRPLRYLGGDQVAYRDSSGTLHVLDAYCRHLGGNLAYGGHVENDCVVCPFHGWHWNAEGRNTHIPYQPDRPNRARTLKVWPVREELGVVYMWHDVEGREPAWEPPNIFTDVAPHTAPLEYYDAERVKFDGLTLHPQLVSENAADPMHFRFVHGARDFPVYLRLWQDDAHYFSQIGFGRKWREMEPDSHDGETLSILVAGVGLDYTALSGSSNTLILLSTTPVDAGTSDMFQTVWLEKLPGDNPEMLSTRLDQAISQLPNDIAIWTHQRFEDPPALATVEGRALGEFRRWARTFYPESADAVSL